MSKRMKRTPTIEEVAAALQQHTRSEVRRFYAPNSCVVTTRIVTNIFTLYGYEAKPLHVDTTVWNPAWVNAIESGERPPYELGNEAVDNWMDERGAWSISTISTEPLPLRHLVVHVPAIDAVLDASINQCDRPARNIKLPECIAFRPEDFFDGATQQVQVNGCWVEYRMATQQKGPWLMSTDWLGSEDSLIVQDNLLRRIEKTLRHQQKRLRSHRNRRTQP